MSVEIKGMGQFATNQGWRDLTRAAADHPTLVKFFSETQTNDVSAVQDALRELAENCEQEDVKSTALGLADMIEGRKFVKITDGAGTYERIRSAKKDTPDRLEVALDAEFDTPNKNGDLR